MTDIAKRATFYAGRSGDTRTFHVETDGATVNITVGLTDAAGRTVTRVDVSPEDETRGGDARGRVWVQEPNGARIIRLDAGEDPARVRAQLADTGRRVVLLVSVLDGHTVATYGDPAAAERHAERINEAVGSTLVVVEHAPFHEPDDSMITELLRNATGK